MTRRKVIHPHSKQRPPPRVQLEVARRHNIDTVRGIHTTTAAHPPMLAVAAMGTALRDHHQTQWRAMREARAMEYVAAQLASTKKG